MKTISLFSGCGGMDIGAEQAGADTILANDIMPEACETYSSIFHGVNIINGDVSRITEWPSADLVIGGYPCQSFSMGGNRNPGADDRTNLFTEFARCVDHVQPKFFVAENVSGLRSLDEGKWLQEQITVFSQLGRHGYELSVDVLRAEEYGIPQRRKRLFIIGVRKDVGRKFVFPVPTHGRSKDIHKTGLVPFESHGNAIAHLPTWPEGEFYERPHDPEGHFSWYYMSRNRKAAWDGPAFTVVANFRHPGSHTMKLTWSNLADGWKQRWDFSEEFEHTIDHPKRMKLDTPRRLSWRECAAIQTFPADFEPVGNLAKKFEQIGNAVPPKLAEKIIRPLIHEEALVPTHKVVEPQDGRQLSLLGI